MRDATRLVDELPEIAEANPAGAGFAVRLARLRLGASVIECAEVAGYCPSWWRLRERGVRAVRPDDAEVIQATLRRVPDRAWMMRTAIGRSWLAGPQAFASTLAGIRHELRMSQEVMSRHLGLGPNYCQRVESAQIHPTIETLRQIVLAIYGGPEHEHPTAD